jgi:acyl carrier protein
MDKTILKIICESLRAEEEDVLSGKSFADLGADSMDNLELLMKFEETFNVYISDAEVEKINNYYDVMDFYKEKAK